MIANGLLVGWLTISAILSAGGPSENGQLDQQACAAGVLAVGHSTSGNFQHYGGVVFPDEIPMPTATGWAIQ